jgi:hypothetical protein
MSFIAFSFVVPAVTATVLPRRSRKPRTRESRRTTSLVPETKIVGEKLTTFERSRLAVVEPHSRSALPEAIASMRDSDVTASHWISSARPTASDIASTSLRQSSIE